MSHQAILDGLRDEASHAKHLYEHNLGVANGIKRGNSVVRNYYVLDEKHFLIEQDISVWLSRAAGSWSRMLLRHVVLRESPLTVYCPGSDRCW